MLQSNAVHLLGEAAVANFFEIRIPLAAAACHSRLPITEARDFGRAASPIISTVRGVEWRREDFVVFSRTETVHIAVHFEIS